MLSNASKASADADADGCTQRLKSAVAALQLQVAQVTAGQEEAQKQLAESAAAAQELQRRAQMPSYTFVSTQTSALPCNVFVHDVACL